jgi:hypothetical protein
MAGRTLISVRSESDHGSILTLDRDVDEGRCGDGDHRAHRGVVCGRSTANGQSCLYTFDQRTRSFGCGNRLEADFSLRWAHVGSAAVEYWVSNVNLVLLTVIRYIIDWKCG